MRITRPLAHITILALVLTVHGRWAPPVFAQDVVEIEEHWTLQVGGPDDTRCAPQVTMVMSANGAVEGEYFLVTLYHCAVPDFSPGGIQVQRCLGDSCVRTAQSISEQLLHHDGETVHWVQRLSLQDCSLTFEVTDGSSQSWGSFGGDGSLRLESPTNLENLNNYLPGVSITESGIGFAGNRVSSLTLQRIRWVTADGEEHEMVAPIDIDSDLDP